MKRTLLLLRHAKSAWDNPKLTDHERVINDRGRADAPKMAKFLQSTGYVPDHIVGSTAIRVRQTIELLMTTWNYQKEVQHFKDLYHGSGGAYARRISEVSNETRILLVVGHNPTIHQIAQHYVEDLEKFSTCALMKADFEIDNWQEFHFELPATDVEYWRPKDPRIAAL